MNNDAYEQAIARGARVKEKHLALLADAFMAGLTYHGKGTIGGKDNSIIDIMKVIGLDKNNAIERTYATKLLERDLCPYLRSEWARMRNLGDL